MPVAKRSARPKAKARALAPDERYDANIDHILRAAAEVFAEKSFGLASIRDIAAHARISFPRIYYYLRNKEELLFLISRRAFEKLSAQAEAQISGSHHPSEKLRRFIGAHLEYQLNNVAEMKVLIRETQSLSGRKAAQIVRLIREYSNLCRKLIEEVAAQEGVALDRETSRIQTSLLFGAMNSVFGWYEAARDREQQDRIVEQIYAMAISAIAKHPTL
ncbi:MAG TPA: TetR/AcrR family transcriptional regulator [Candidatus Binataceae bacterium]|nr:TetR/AcrR family transcriptional regulator [Candidatus Binataceae bacterium]